MTTNFPKERLNSDLMNISKVFKLNWNMINQYLDNLHKKEYLKVVRTSGLDVISIITEHSNLEILEKHYLANEGN